MIHHPISISAYRDLGGMSNSLMKEFDQSAKHVFNAMTQPRDTSDAMLLGNLTDHLLFGTEFAYVVSPYAKFQSDASKDWKASQEEAGFCVFKDAAVEGAKTMVHRIKTHPAAAQILKTGRAQIGMTHDLEHDGIRMLIKGLADWVSDEVAVLTDLKTTEDASEKAFQKQIVNMGYDAQAALYSDLWKWNTGEKLAWVWIVSESKPPHETAVYVASDAVLERGRKLYRERLSKYAKVLKTGVWQGYPDEAQTIELPDWMMK